MSEPYAWLKLVHIIVAIVALGTSAGLGILLEFFARHPQHGAFMLRAIERLTALVVLPGYLLMLATGLWMVSLAWPLTLKWIQLALALWTVGLVALGWSFAATRRRALAASRLAGGVFGLVVVSMLYLMVFKP
jgi:uncharacterized membrane protein